MRQRWRAAAAPGVAAAYLLAAAPAWAASGPALSEPWLGLPRWVWATVNLLIFWGLLLRLAGPGVRRFLNQRAERIAAEVAQAGRNRREAETMRGEIERALEEMRREVAELLERARAAGEQEREVILERLEHEQAQLVAQSRREIEARALQARTELRRFAAELAAKIAGERLHGTLSGDDRARYFEQSLALLERELLRAEA